MRWLQHIPSRINLLRAKRRLRGRRCLRAEQARQELNPQPPVLETGALPIELLAYEPPGNHRQMIPWLMNYFVSRCNVCLRQRLQYLLNSRRPGSLRRFFSVV